MLLGAMSFPVRYRHRAPDIPSMIDRCACSLIRPIPVISAPTATLATIGAFAVTMCNNGSGAATPQGHHGGEHHQHLSRDRHLHRLTIIFAVRFPSGASVATSMALRD
jgi:hypothetical protein